MGILMAAIRKIPVSPGIFWVEFPSADVRVLCGCPVDAVKHLMRRGLIVPIEIAGIECESGPNTILLSDLPIQNGKVCNRSEFPVLQMLYKQGMILPGHPSNTGALPTLIGARGQVTGQLNYIFRGNYGLVSREELIAADVAPELADEIMRMKLAFAFGNIRPSEELVRPLFLERDPIDIGNGVFVRRERTNVFEFSFAGEQVVVDLNLGPGEAYECPYTLDMHLLEREYFSIVHMGDGDGWDMNRPAMGSIVLFQGRIYLIDAGPNIDYALNALGIGINEIDGIFHTHAHDDHQSGLSMLLRRDNRMPYYAVPMVRDSVMKKLTAAMQLPESEFSHLFDVRDLRLDEWNDIEGLEVKPVLSPHPVETTIFFFRSVWEGGYRSYAHLADIASFDVLRKMIAPDNAPAGISEAMFEKTKSAYLQKADIKKIDIGGGMIHGSAADFSGDPSGKLILAHVARRLTQEERAIGAGAPFGTIDTLIRGTSDTNRHRAFGYLSDYFPESPRHMIRHLLNGKVIVFNPETFLFKEGQAVDSVYLVLNGSVETLRTGETSGIHNLTAGSMLGETQVLLDVASTETYRAASFVRALRLPKDVYIDFVTRSGRHADIVKSREQMDFFRRSTIFADDVSCVTLSQLTRVAELVTFDKDKIMVPPDEELLLVRSGSVLLTTPFRHDERLGVGENIGAMAISRKPPEGTQVRFLEPSDVYQLPLDSLADIPIVRWKLIETNRKRFSDRRLVPRKARNPRA